MTSDWTLFGVMNDDPEAFAKRDDPQTSWDAAHSLEPDSLRVRLKAVYEVLRLVGPLHNDALTVEYRRLMDRGQVPVQTDQSVRSRRAELTDRGLCVDTGERFILPTGRKAVVWAIAT